MEDHLNCFKSLPFVNVKQLIYRKDTAPNVRCTGQLQQVKGESSDTAQEQENSSV